MQYRSILVLKMKIGSNLRIYLTETRKEADRIYFEIKRQTMIITQNMFSYRYDCESGFFPVKITTSPQQYNIA